MKYIAYESMDYILQRTLTSTMSSCKHGDELGQINDEGFLDLESDCRFFKKDSVLQKFDMIQILVTADMWGLS